MNIYQCIYVYVNSFKSYSKLQNFSSQLNPIAILQVKYSGKLFLMEIIEYFHSYIYLNELR